MLLYEVVFHLFVVFLVCHRYTSPIDGRSLTDVPSIQVHSSCDFSKRDIYRIRWTNVFLERSGSSSRGLSSRGLTRLTGELARACCEALGPYLQGLFNMGLTQLSLRVNVDAESVSIALMREVCKIYNMRGRSV